VRKKIIAGAVAMFGITPVLATESPKDFPAAKRIADAHDHDQKMRTYNKAFGPFYAKTYNKVLDNCFTKVSKPDSSPFSIILVVESDGSISKTFLNKKTNIALCLQNVIQSDKAPMPPFAPLYQEINMSFVTQ
jgi:hypothetical protein